MTKADGTPPSAEETANYTERLLAALTRLLGDDDSARASMETTLERARAGNALRGVSEEALDEYLRRVCARVEKHIDDLTLTTTRRGTSLSNKKSKVADVMELTVQECYREFSEELLCECWLSAPRPGCPIPRNAQGVRYGLRPTVPHDG